MSKFSYTERSQIKDIVATLSLKRITDEQIIEFIQGQTNKTITARSLRRIRQRLKVESFNCTQRCVRVDTNTFMISVL